MCGLPSDLTVTVSMLSNAYVCVAVHKVLFLGFFFSLLCDNVRLKCSFQCNYSINKVRVD